MEGQGDAGNTSPINQKLTNLPIKSHSLELGLGQSSGGVSGDKALNFFAFSVFKAINRLQYPPVFRG